MRIDIMTAIPSLLVSPFNDSIIKRAKEKKLVEINIHNLRDFSTHKQKSIDGNTCHGQNVRKRTPSPSQLPQVSLLPWRAHAPFWSAWGSLGRLS